MTKESPDDSVTLALIRIAGSVVDGPAILVNQVSHALQRVIEALTSLVSTGAADELSNHRIHSQRRREAATLIEEAKAQQRMAEAAAASSLATINKAKARLLEAQAVTAEVGARLQSAIADAVVSGLDEAAIQAQNKLIEQKARFLRAARGTRILVNRASLLDARAAITVQVARHQLSRGGKLFGTDGIRGMAGRSPLEPFTVRRLGAAFVRALRSSKPISVVLGRDTRESGVWIANDLTLGVRSEGGTVVDVGVVPTPALAYLTRTHNFDLGIMISASHNPYEDNGIKLFGSSAVKVDEDFETRVETVMFDDAWAVGEPRAKVHYEDVSQQYLDHLRVIWPNPERLAGLRVVLDCANGAAAGLAPGFFRSLGLDARTIGASPDGRNINLNCGATHLEALSLEVVKEGARLGIAFDGDADRALFIDASGKVVDGDAVLLMLAIQMKNEGMLTGDAVVTTVMSNIGLEIALKGQGISVFRTAVGDKYVAEEMSRRGVALGGEQSGHIIVSNHLFTGDGLATALNVLRIMAITGKEIGELAAALVRYPQVLINVRVREKVDYMTVPSVADAVRRVEQELAGDGRLLVRYSGTEPLLRIMIEGRDDTRIRAWANDIADAVRREMK